MQSISQVTDEVLAALEEEAAVRRTREFFLLFPLGSHFERLISLALAKLGVWVVTADTAKLSADDVKRLSPIGIILSGGPDSVYETPPLFDEVIFDLGIPTLGICLGAQLGAQHFGFTVRKGERAEFGVHRLKVRDHRGIFRTCRPESKVLQNHHDIIAPHPLLEVLAETENSPVAAFKFEHFIGLQFHPEVQETEEGLLMLKNFCFPIAGALDRFPARDVAREKITELRPLIAGKRVLVAASGGNDSSVVLHLLKEAASEGTELIAVYIQGVDRPDDAARVKKFFGSQSWVKLVVVDATAECLIALSGVIEMPQKRAAFKPVYHEVLEEEIRRWEADIAAQGTLWADITESGGGRKSTIKKHHNVGLTFSIPLLEPLSDQVKDGARAIGRSIGVPEELMTAHPFPGPGLVVRIDGEVTERKLRIARDADRIFIEELRHWGLYDTVWQAGAVVTETMVTCNKGEGGVTGRLILLWAVNSIDGLTATRARLPEDFWNRVNQRICNEIPEVGSTAERKTGKPPATIEIG